MAPEYPNIPSLETGWLGGSGMRSAALSPAVVEASGMVERQVYGTIPSFRSSTMTSRFAARRRSSSSSFMKLSCVCSNLPRRSSCRLMLTAFVNLRPSPTCFHHRAKHRYWAMLCRIPASGSIRDVRWQHRERLELAHCVPTPLSHRASAAATATPPAMAGTAVPE